MPTESLDLDAWGAAEQATMAASRFPHVWVNPHAGKPCDNGSCMWCEGGLTVCSQCNAFEGATPTECPQRRMSADESDAVYHGLLDFRQGGWQLRPARWIECQEAFSKRPSELPAPLVLTGLPVVDGAAHHAVFDPDTYISQCLPDCPGCALAVRKALEADACRS